MTEEMPFVTIETVTEELFARHERKGKVLEIYRRLPFGAPKIALTRLDSKTPEYIPYTSFNFDPTECEKQFKEQALKAIRKHMKKIEPQDNKYYNQYGLSANVCIFETSRALNDELKQILLICVKNNDFVSFGINEYHPIKGTGKYKIVPLTGKNYDRIMLGHETNKGCDLNE